MAIGGYNISGEPSDEWMKTMARGRIITNEITKDRQVNELSSDTSRLAFTWLVTFADKEGRTYGDPALVRSMLFPRRDDITIEQMTAYIQEWQEAGFIQWYEAGGDRWIYFTGFDKNQPGLRKEKEPPSRIPPPPGWTEPPADDDADGTPEVRQDDAESPPDVPDKGREVEGNSNGIEKGKEGNGNSLAANAPALAIYQNIRLIYMHEFPDKAKPRANTKSLVGKVRTRMESAHFADHWHSALTRAGRSDLLRKSGWFDLSWFLKNDDNYEKCLNGNYDSTARAGPQATTSADAIIDEYLKENPDGDPQ